MRIYAVADIHGKPERFERIRHHISALQPHVLIAAGDLTGRGSPQATLQRLNALSVPVFYVRGNSDGRGLDCLGRGMPNIRSLHLSRVVVHAVPLAGISGTLPIPFRSKISLHEAALLRRAEALVDDRTILVVHPPPCGLLDTALGRFHAGSPNLRRFIETLQPRLVICGHIHECAGMATLGETMIVNCAMNRNHDGAVIDFTPERELKIAMI